MFIVAINIPAEDAAVQRLGTVFRWIERRRCVTRNFMYAILDSGFFLRWIFHQAEEAAAFSMEFGGTMVGLSGLSGVIVGQHPTSASANSATARPTLRIIR